MNAGLGRIIGWTAILAASVGVGVAAFGVAVRPPAAVVPNSIDLHTLPQPAPTIINYETKTIVDPGPTVTVDVPVAPAPPTRTPTRTSGRTVQDVSQERPSPERGDDDDESGHGSDDEGSDHDGGDDDD